MPFKFQRLRIPEVVLIEARSFGDDRGLFREIWKASEFAAAGFDLHFVQDNHSRSICNVLRGLHFQRPPHAQGKLVFTLSGEIFDVAVDIRTGSPTFGQWVGATLSGDNGCALWVPPGFLHGFVSLEDHTIFSYKCTALYDAAAEFSVRWDDPSLGIAWPGMHDATPFLIAAKDAAAPLLADVPRERLPRYEGAEVPW